MKKIILFVLLMPYLSAFTGDNKPIDACLKKSENCASVDMDHPKAAEAYKKGCDSKDYYSCYRLGQFYEVSTKNIKKAMKYYSVSCDGKDKYGCEGKYELTMVLCYIKNQEDYCGVIEPKGEYRILEYLSSFKPKYSDCFNEHDFSYDFSMNKTKVLFEKRVKEKNKTLLKTLEKSRDGRFHDGAAAETLSSYIRVLKGGEFYLNGM